MCGLAELLHNVGAQVSGSDAAENANTQRLRELGLKVFIGHKAEQIGNADVVVYSSAISFQNPEIKEARARAIPLIPRAEALSENHAFKAWYCDRGNSRQNYDDKSGVFDLSSSHNDPTIVVGGRLGVIRSTAMLGQGEWLIAEADESDGSFHKLSPEISVITNIDSDHLDHFKTFENLQKSFYDFALRAPFYGGVIVCGDDPIVRELFQNFPKRILFYGFNDGNDYQLRGEKGQYQLFHTDKKTGKQNLCGDFEMPIPGRHNALNACAAIIVGLEAGISFENCQKGLMSFQGVERRFQFKGEKNSIRVYDDYGHHPTEVKATLSAFREKYPQKRVVVMFQPHRYSRTESCWHEFTQCFSQCDSIILTDIYAAGEQPIEGISSERLVQEIKHDNKTYLPKDANLTASIMKTLKEGDVFVTLGAGDGWKIGMEVLEKI